MLKTGLTLACLLLAACLGAAVRAAPLPDFSASYELRVGNLRIGTSTLSLENGTGGSYVYESRSTPIKLVSWLFREELYETSKGTLAGAGIRPHSYHYLRSGARLREEQLEFDWQAMTVTSSLEDSHSEMDIPAGTLDKLASQLAMMLALRDGATDISLRIADDDKLKEYRFRVVGRETLELPAGTFDTIKITKLRNNRKRETYIWCAPALNYLPVRIWQREKDNTEYLSELEGFSESLRTVN